MAALAPIRSMTGFASVEGALRGRSFRAEIKALNHRFLEVKVRLPRALASCEQAARQWVQKRLARGAVDLKIEPISGASQMATDWRINSQALEYYCGEMRKLARDLGVTSEIRVSELMQLPDALVRAGEGESDLSAIEAAELEPLVQKALGSLLKMRETEGAALAQVLVKSLDQLAERSQRLRQLRETGRGRSQEQLGKKIRAAFEAHPVQGQGLQAAIESRVSQELALLLERTDVEEELSRLEGHLNHAREVLLSGGPVGRKLEFLFQEMHREVNTLANKAQDLEMSSEAVEAKILVEQLREQSLNVE
ncbi:MAG: YicC family protein [Bdellovibrionales bacterium]|nr:YicC family protein [Bdellovibrionales bacterium]